MHATFTDDQLLFRDTARDILDNECTPAAVRAAARPAAVRPPSVRRPPVWRPIRPADQPGHRTSQRRHLRDCIFRPFIK